MIITVAAVPECRSAVATIFSNAPFMRSPVMSTISAMGGQRYPVPRLRMRSSLDGAALRRESSAASALNRRYKNNLQWQYLGAGFTPHRQEGVRAEREYTV